MRQEPPHREGLGHDGDDAAPTPAAGTEQDVDREHGPRVVDMKADALVKSVERRRRR